MLLRTEHREHEQAKKIRSLEGQVKELQGQLNQKRSRAESSTPSKEKKAEKK